MARISVQRTCYYKHPTSKTGKIQIFNLNCIETSLAVYRNLDTQNSPNLRILAEPCLELAEPVGSVEKHCPKVPNSSFSFRQKNPVRIHR